MNNSNSTTMSAGLCPTLTAMGVIKLIVGVLFTLPSGVINGTFLIAIYRNRRKTWARKLKYVTCLIAGDSIFGFVNTFLAINRLLPLCVRSEASCVFTEYAFISSQLISLNNILAVCVDRFLRIVKLTRLDNPLIISPYLVCTFIWIGTLFLCGLPYIIWTNKDGETTVVCSSTYIFDDTPKAAVPYFAVLLSAPLFLTNILYLVLCVLLWRKLRRVQPQQKDFVQPTTSTVTDRGPHNDSNVPRAVVKHGSNKLFRVSNSVTSGVTVKASTNIPKPGAEVPEHITTKTTKVVRAVTTENKASRERANAIDAPQNPLFVHHRDSMNKKVLVTIGALMLIHDSSMWPLVCHFLGRLAIPDFHIQGTFYLLLFLNQIVNPFIYTMRFQQLREAHLTCMRSLCRIQRAR